MFRICKKSTIYCNKTNSQFKLEQATKITFLGEVCEMNSSYASSMFNPRCKQDYDKVLCFLKKKLTTLFNCKYK